MISLTINGKSQPIDLTPDTPLLWALRDHLSLVGTKFGCGMALRGACTIHVDGEAVRSCSAPIGAMVGKNIVTIEGLAAPYGQAASGPASLDRDGRGPARLLPDRPDHERGGAALRDPPSHRRRHRRGAGGQHLPLRHLSAHSRRRASRGRDRSSDMIGREHQHRVGAVAGFLDLDCVIQRWGKQPLGILQRFGVVDVDRRTVEL